MRVQRGKSEMSSDAWAEGCGRGLALWAACHCLCSQAGTYKHTEEMERLAAVDVSCKRKPTRQAALLSQQGCNSAGGLIVLPWSEIIQITPSHTCLDR